ncbi:MAG: dTDP-4-dehydrorhamnose reductase [Brevinematia bacterium]
MKILLIGAYGQLGTEFRRFFEEHNIDYIPTSTKEREGKNLVLDIANINKVKEVFSKYKFDVVINCSAYNYVDKAEEEWQKAYSINGLGVRNLAIESNKKSIPLVHYSTDYVFDGSKTTPFTIADIPNPLSKYGKSKLLGENFLKSLTNKYILIRVSWVFGKGGETNFIKKLIEWSKKGEVRVSTDEISAPTYTKTIVNATWKLLEVEGFGIYHLSNEGECSRYEYAKFILETLNWKGKLYEAKQEDFNLPARRPKYSKLDNFGMKETIKIEIPHWKEVVGKYMKEELNL